MLCFNYKSARPIYLIRWRSLGIRGAQLRALLEPRWHFGNMASKSLVGRNYANRHVFPKNAEASICSRVVWGSERCFWEALFYLIRMLISNISNFFTIVVVEIWRTLPFTGTFLHLNKYFNESSNK